MSSRSLPLLLLLTLCLAISSPSISTAQNNNAREAQSIGEITPSFQYQKSVIAVAPFQVESASVEIETFPRIIRNDLELSGLFSMPEDQRRVNRQNQIDNSSGDGIQWDAWRAMGVEHYLMGRVRETNGDLAVTILLYDVASGRLVINRTFNAPKTRARHLAHQISDATMLQIKGIDGIFQTKLLYVSEMVPGTKEIAVMDADGYDPRQVTRLGKLAISPEWGANGTEIYFTSYHGNRAIVYGMQFVPDLATMRYSPGDMWRIAAYGGTNHSPKWNSQSRRVVMVLSKDGNSEIYTAGRDGSDLQRLTRTRATEGSPEWSPDGRQIAYTSNETGSIAIHVMNADGSNQRRLTRHGGWNDAVAWSPDGTRLAFVLREGGRNDIYLCDANATRASYRRLTMNQGNNESPVWAPNGRHLAFASDRSGQWQIYMMLDDGSNQRQLTSSGRNSMPAWGPLPNLNR